MRNEAAFLGKCLDALDGKVDEIVVVDTGSTDNTAAIATSKGARLLHFEWIDDFAAARNCAIEAATGDWILYIDADEVLETPVPLRDSVSEPGHVGFMLKFRPQLGYSPYHEMRLFKADPRIRFEGRMHERVLASIDRVRLADGLRIGHADVAIQHLGYEGDQTRKHGRNLPLLMRAVQDDPDRVYLWWHLGETLSAVGDKQGSIEAFRRAIEIADRTRTARARIEASMAAQSLARLYLDGGDYTKAEAVVEQGLELRPGDPALLLLKGRTLVDLGQMDEALVTVSSLPRKNPQQFFDPDLAYDLRIFAEWPYAMMGLIEFRLGRFQASHDAYRAAAAAAPGVDEYPVKAALAAARAAADLSRRQRRT